jgi:superoxide dismutase, Cu-Zn family
VETTTVLEDDMRTMVMAALGAAVVAGCTMPDTGGGADAAAVADLTTANGQPVGRATATPVGSDLRISIDGRSMPPGPHGAHIHTVGRCDAPTFESAGGHWNPTSKQHGMQNPAGPHVGDMPNLDVASDGSGTLSFTLPGGTLDGLFDADGSAMMIHAGPDDMRTDPSGNSGGRIACGVFRRA